MADNQLRVGEAIIDLLAREYGVDVVFGIPGVHNIELYRGLHRSGVRAISPRHEQGAGFMADGWSIITGRPGVCVLISGPGVTNVLTPIASIRLSDWRMPPSSRPKRECRMRAQTMSHKVITPSVT